MVWDIASNKTPNQNFKFLGLRLLLVYIIAMAAILGISAASLYIYFARNLNANLNERLLVLAQAAVPSLNPIGDRNSENLDPDLLWQNLFDKGKQSLEWFDEGGNLLARKGIFFPEFPLVKQVATSQVKPGSPIIQQQNLIRSVTISVYAYDLDRKNLQLKGYIRASQSTQQLEATLEKLRFGLFSGGVGALILILISSLYLTKQALKPTLQSYQQLTRFTADASHELRHPLTSINIAADIMLSHSEGMKPTDIKKLKMVKKAVAQMKDLVEDLLLLARNDIEHLSQTKEKVICSLKEMLEDLVESFEPIAATKNIRLNFNCCEDILVQGNLSQLNRVFANLVDNGIKYNRPGGSVTISLTRVKDNALISIEDTGIGIPAEELPNLFDRFWRADRTRSGPEAGFGLGLAIVIAIVEKHGGKIQVRSELDKGTCFEIYLPEATRSGNYPKSEISSSIIDNY